MDVEVFLSALLLWLESRMKLYLVATHTDMAAGLVFYPRAKRRLAQSSSQVGPWSLLKSRTPSSSRARRHP